MRTLVLLSRVIESCPDLKLEGCKERCLNVRHVLARSTTCSPSFRVRRRPSPFVTTLWSPYLGLSISTLSAAPLRYIARAKSRKDALLRPLRVCHDCVVWVVLQSGLRTITLRDDADRERVARSWFTTLHGPCHLSHIRASFNHESRHNLLSGFPLAALAPYTDAHSLLAQTR